MSIQAEQLGTGGYQRRAAICDILAGLMVDCSDDGVNPPLGGPTRNDSFVVIAQQILPEDYLDRYRADAAGIVDPTLLETRIQAIPQAVATLLADEVITFEQAEDAFVQLEPLLGRDLLEEYLGV